jgi:hypothetical protein
VEASHGVIPASAGPSRYNARMQRPAIPVECPDDGVVEILRGKTPEERLAMGVGMWLAARKILENLLASQHPDWGRDRLSREVARRLSHGSV